MKSIHTKDDYPQVIRDLDAYLHHDKENPLPIAVNPKIDTEPELWTLSHSEETAQLAAELGLGYVFGIFPYMPLNTMEEAKKFQLFITRTLSRHHKAHNHILH